MTLIGKQLIPTKMLYIAGPFESFYVGLIIGSGSNSSGRHHSLDLGGISMLNFFMRVLLVLTAAIWLSATSALADGTPDPGMSTVPEYLITCPAGDISFEVTVLDATGAPCPGVAVVIDFCDCPEAQLCLYAGGASCNNGKNDLLVMITDASGVALFNPAAGGICGGSAVDIVAGGILLAQRLVRTMDVTGNFIVEIDDFTYDNVWNDYNGDGFSNLADLAIFNMHAAGPHTCEAPVSEATLSWGGIKALWR